MVGTKPDDLEAVRKLVETLEPFDSDERERIIRWACEKLGMRSTSTSPREISAPTSLADSSVLQRASSGTDIKSFVQMKDPKSAQQFVAVVAYYYAFEAPQAERKDTIGVEEVTDACRKAVFKRPKNISQTLINTLHAGYIDRSGSGRYKINSVGENLVSMALPGGNSLSAKRSSKAKPKRSRPKPKHK